MNVFGSETSQRPSAFTDDLQVVKEHHGPIKATWSQLSPTQDAAARQCDTSESTVTDAATLTDAQAIAITQDNPYDRLKIELSQPNLRLTHHDLTP